MKDVCECVCVCLCVCVWGGGGGVMIRAHILGASH